ncbi:MAG: hypothetical protein Q4D92_08690, partial [Slackia sp.]|nr:hypothetical protein [Slackia sp.]
RSLQAASRGGFPPTVITSFEWPVRMPSHNDSFNVEPAPFGLNPFGTIANIKSKSVIVNLSDKIFGMLPKCHFR